MKPVSLPRYITWRIALMLPTLFLVSVIAFGIIQLPPGDYLTTVAANAAQGGERIDAGSLATLRQRYGLGESMVVQYWRWIHGILTRGDFGLSFEWNRPVWDLLSSRIPLTVLVAAITLVVSWAVSIPIGLYSAVRQYSVGDYVATTVGFLGLATPNFLLALILIWLGVRFFGQSVGGLFSAEYVDAAWSVGKFADLLQHLWIPVFVLGTAGIAALIRILRANLLDELQKPYVVAARARGMSERRLIVRYPLRVALNPFVSTIGWTLPALVSGEVVVASILSLPTVGPLLLSSLRGQDMYLAGSIVFILSLLTVIGTLISDLLLAWLDPRIRRSLGRGGTR